MDTRILAFKKILFFIGVVWSSTSFSQLVEQRQPNKWEQKLFVDQDYVESKRVVRQAKKRSFEKRVRGFLITDENFTADLQALRALPEKHCTHGIRDSGNDHDLPPLCLRKGEKGVGAHEVFNAESGDFHKVIRKITSASDFFDQSLFPTREEAVEELAHLYRQHSKNKQKLKIAKNIEDIKKTIERVKESCKVIEQKVEDATALLKQADPNFYEIGFKKIKWCKPLSIESELQPLTLSGESPAESKKCTKCAENVLGKFAPPNAQATITKFLDNFNKTKEEFKNKNTEQLLEEQKKLFTEYESWLKKQKKLETKYDFLDKTLQALRQENPYPDRPTDEELATCLDREIIIANLSKIVEPITTNAGEALIVEKAFKKCLEIANGRVPQTIKENEKFKIDERDKFFDAIQRRINVFSTLTVRFKEVKRRYTIHIDAFLAKIKELTANDQKFEELMQEFEEFKGFEIEEHIPSQALNIQEALAVIPDISEHKNLYMRVLGKEIILELDKLEALYKEAHKEFTKAEIIFATVYKKYQELLNHRMAILHEYTEDCRQQIKKMAIVELSPIEEEGLLQAEDNFVSQKLTKVLKNAEATLKKLQKSPVVVETSQEKAQNFIRELNSQKDKRVLRLVGLYEYYTEPTRLQEKINNISGTIAIIETTYANYETVVNQLQLENNHLYFVLLHYYDQSIESFTNAIALKLDAFKQGYKPLLEKPKFTVTESINNCLNLAQTFENLSSQLGSERMTTEVAKIFTTIEEKKETVEKLKRELAELENNRATLVSKFDVLFKKYFELTAANKFLRKEKETWESNQKKELQKTKNKQIASSPEQQKKVTVPSVSTDLDSLMQQIVDRQEALD